MSILQRTGVIHQWHDRNISAGTDWQGLIDQRLEDASLILLLISANFLASDYCYDIEMQRALERHQAGEARVIPVILQPVDWQGAEFGALQALPVDAKPVTTWENQEAAFTSIAQGIRAAITEMLHPPTSRASADVQPTSPSVMWQPLPQPALRILHLSDLHLTASDDSIVRLQPLLADLRDKEGGFGFERLDYLVLSGDLTNRATPEEFDKVYELISLLIERFDLSAERCIMVPGNHDLSWDEQVYEWKQQRLVDPQKLPIGSFVPQGNGYLVRNDEQYHTRFRNFDKFYHSLVQQPYPLQADEQGLASFFPEAGLQFLALNSAWEIDEFFKDRSSINDRALSRALLKADEQLGRARNAGTVTADTALLRLAVWHHPVTGNEKILSDAFLARLGQAEVRLCLHGHVHEERADLIGYWHPTRQLHVVGAGSFGAVASDRPESTPRLYNLLEIARDHSWVKVHTRHMRKDGGAWEGWAVWPGTSPHDKRTYYTIDLTALSRNS